MALEHAGVDGPRQQGVVDAEEDVALGVPGGQHRLVDDLAGVPAGDDLDGDAGARLEVAEQGLGHGERVVRRAA